MARTISHSFAALTREILLPLGHKIYILSPPCNILYIFNRIECILVTFYPWGQSVMLTEGIWISLEFNPGHNWFFISSQLPFPGTRSEEGLTLETSAFESLYDGQFTLLTQWIKPKLTCNTPTGAAPHFL